jgi:hypothetical protein
MAYVDLRSFATSVPFGVGSTSFISNLSAVGTVWDIDRFTIFANWIFFLIFAFSRWPGALVVDSARPSSSPPGGSPQYGLGDSRLPNPSPGSIPSPMGATSSSPPHFQNVVGGERARDALTANATPAANAGAVRTKHCVWCGESLPGSRALFHDCGSKDRPATNCVACGAALSSEGAPCRACARANNPRTIDVAFEAHTGERSDPLSGERQIIRYREVRAQRRYDVRVQSTVANIEALSRAR